MCAFENVLLGKVLWLLLRMVRGTVLELQIGSNSTGEYSILLS